MQPSFLPGKDEREWSDRGSQDHSFYGWDIKVLYEIGQ